MENFKKYSELFALVLIMFFSGLGLGVGTIFTLSQIVNGLFYFELGVVILSIIYLAVLVLVNLVLLRLAYWRFKELIDKN